MMTSLQDMMDLQAAWLGVPTPERVQIDAPLRRWRHPARGERGVSRAAHARPHAGQHQPVDSLRAKAGGGRHAVPGSIGRTDLPGGDGRQILRSIHEKLLPLPEETTVIPGHGGLTTIGHEKRFNFFLQG